MIPERFAFRGSVFSRLLIFVATLVIGLGLSQIGPLRMWKGANAIKAPSSNHEFKRDCPRYR
jgi:hypothetical protein